MTQTLLLAWASPASAEDSTEFDQWYSTVHIPQMRANVPSISRVSRYALADPASGETSARFLAIYELDSDDVPAAAAALQEGVGSGRIEPTSTMNVADAPPLLEWYSALD